MDPTVIAGMIFSLLVIMLIGGFILLFPISRRLGRLLEQRIRERSEDGLEPRQLEPIHEALDAIRAEIDAINERQQFVERVLESRQETEALPTGSRMPTDAD